MTINEENGVIYGRYRARFEVVDRPISPDVNFTFTGPSSSGSQSGFPWTGSGGAKGELTLRLVSENSMRIDWTATELGTQLGTRRRHSNPHAPDRIGSDLAAAPLSMYQAVSGDAICDGA